MFLTQLLWGTAHCNTSISMLESCGQGKGPAVFCQDVFMMGENWWVFASGLNFAANTCCSCGTEHQLQPVVLLQSGMAAAGSCSLAAAMPFI